MYARTLPGPKNNPNYVILFYKDGIQLQIQVACPPASRPGDLFSSSSFNSLSIPSWAITKSSMVGKTWWLGMLTSGSLLVKTDSNCWFNISALPLLQMYPRLIHHNFLTQGFLHYLSATFFTKLQNCLGDSMQEVHTQLQYEFLLVSFCTAFLRSLNFCLSASFPVDLALLNALCFCLNYVWSAELSKGGLFSLKLYLKGMCVSIQSMIPFLKSVQSASTVESLVLRILELRLDRSFFKPSIFA